MHAYTKLPNTRCDVSPLPQTSSTTPSGRTKWEVNSVVTHSAPQCRNRLAVDCGHLISHTVCLSIPTLAWSRIRTLVCIDPYRAQQTCRWHHARFFSTAVAAFVFRLITHASELHQQTLHCSTSVLLHGHSCCCKGCCWFFSLED